MCHTKLQWPSSNRINQKMLPTGSLSPISTWLVPTLRPQLSHALVHGVNTLCAPQSCMAQVEHGTGSPNLNTLKLLSKSISLKSSLFGDNHCIMLTNLQSYLHVASNIRYYLLCNMKGRMSMVLPCTIHRQKKHSSSPTSYPDLCNI